MLCARDSTYNLSRVNRKSRDMLSRRLTRNGYEIVIAINGKEGFEKALSEKPYLILMDVSLPVIDGWEATRRIKADEAELGSRRTDRRTDGGGLGWIQSPRNPST
jgi:CheY-like chemotaxis protein